MVNKYSIEEFASFIRDSYGDDLSTFDDLGLVQEYFKQNPDTHYLDQLENPDLVFPTTLDQEPVASVPTPTAVQEEELTPEEAQRQTNFRRAEEQYLKYGSDAAPGMTKQLLHNMDAHMKGIPGAVVGMIGAGLNALGLDDDASVADYAESLRVWGKDYIQEKVENDMELMALQIWNEDEEVEFTGDGMNILDGDIFVRSLASALPSMIEMSLSGLITGGIGTGLYVGKGMYGGKKAMDAWNIMKASGKASKFLGLNSVGQKFGAMGMATALEGSETWNTAMEYGKEQGMSNQDAASVAAVATSIAAPIKGTLEYLSFGRMMKGMGLSEVGVKELSRILAGKTVKNALIKGGKVGLENNITEGLTEWLQFMTDAMVQQGYKEGFNTEEGIRGFLTDAKKVVLEEGWSAEARASVHGGMILGTGTGVVQGTTGGYTQMTPEKYDKELKNIDDQIAKIKRDYPDDLNALKLIEQYRIGRYVAAGERAVSGLNDEQRKEFFEETQKIRDARDESPGFDESLADEATPVDRKKGLPSVEQLDNYVDGVLSSKQFKAEGFERELLDGNAIESTDDKETDEYKLWKKLLDVEAESGKFRSLYFLQEAGDKGFASVNKRPEKERNAFYSYAMTAIKEQGGLPSTFDITATSTSQKEQIVKMFVKEGKYEPSKETDVGGQKDVIITPHSAEELAIIYSGQDVTSDDVIAALAAEQNISGLKEEEYDSLIETIANPNQDVDSLIDAFVSQEATDEEKEAAVTAASVPKGGNPLINASTAKLLKERGVAPEEMGKMTQEEIDKKLEEDVVAPERKVTTVKKTLTGDTRKDPDKVFIFGDNLEGDGKGGQAVIRDEPNAFGIPTKKDKGKGTTSYMTDDEYDANVKAIDDAIALIPKDKDVVFPEDGIGTGRASLMEKAPKTYEYLRKKLKEELGLDLPSMPSVPKKSVTTKDETYTLEDLEKSASLEERTVEEITAFMHKRGHTDWTDEDSQGNIDYDIKSNELYKNDPIAYLEDLIKNKEETIGYFDEGKVKDSYIKTNSLRKALLKQMKEDKKLSSTPSAIPKKPVPKKKAKKFEWSRYKKPKKPSYEVSTQGDAIFSALRAKLPDGRTIEEVYQNDVKAKIGTGVTGKGKYDPNVDIEVYYEAYKKLWQEWARNNPQEIERLRTAAEGKTLTDKFAKSPVSQARALAEILNEGVPEAEVKEEVGQPEVTKFGVSTYKKMFSYLSDKYNAFASKIKETMKVKGMAKGEKLWQKYAAWYGEIDYTYTDKTHASQKMPDEFQAIAREIEKELGVEEGYFNSALANVFPAGTELGEHADDEAIFVRDNGTIGKVATISLGGATDIVIKNKKTGETETIRVEDGDMYVMPGNKFQIEHKHQVMPTDGNRVSITFRHIPKARLAEDTYNAIGEDTRDDGGTRLIVPKEETVAAVRKLVEAGLGISLMRQGKGVTAQYGNPFSHLDRHNGLVQTENLEQTLEAYKHWLETGEIIGTVIGVAVEGKATDGKYKGMDAVTFDFEALRKAEEQLEAQREWILNQIKSGALEGATLVYFKDTKNNHAKILQEFINRGGAKPLSQEEVRAKAREKLKAKLEEAKRRAEKRITPGTDPLKSQDPSAAIDSEATDAIPDNDGDGQEGFSAGNGKHNDDDVQNALNKLAETPPSDDSSTSQDEDEVQPIKPVSGAVKVTRSKGNRKIVLSNGQEIQFNDDQQTGYDKLVAFITKKVGHFGLAGYAGTGKSTLLAEVVRFIKKNKLGEVGMAVPTHKAKNVLIAMGNENAGTLASMMNFKKNWWTGKFEPKTKSNGELEANKNLEDLRGGFLIIDEGSMIDDDMLELMLSQLEAHNIMAIFTGDDKQAAPVGQNHSSFMRLGEEKWGVHFESHQLTMVERQAATNPLFSIYTQLRNRIGLLVGGNVIPFLAEYTGTLKTNLSSWKTNFNEIGEGFAETGDLNTFLEKAIEYFTSNEGLADLNYVSIVTGTNNRSNLLNELIRKRIHGKESSNQIVLNEKMMPQETRYLGDADIQINSTPFEVLELEEGIEQYMGIDIEHYKLKVRDGIDKDGKDINVRTIKVAKNQNAPYITKSAGSKFINSNDNYMRVWKDLNRKVETALGDEERKQAVMQFDNFQATFIRQFVIENKVINQNGKMVTEFIEPDLSYSYAINTHKAQGSTFTHVFYDGIGFGHFRYAASQDGDDRKGIKQMLRQLYGRTDVTDWDRRVVHNMVDRLVYTAVTRPTTSLWMLRDPYMKEFEDGKNFPDLNESTKPPMIEYQTEGGIQPKYQDERVLFEDIKDRLSKHFPEISLEGMERIFKEDGSEALGRAMGMIAQWSKSKATLDTVPHEYAHIYLNMYENTPVVKQGINKFGKEELADYMGLYYADRMGAGLKKRFGMWVKQFWLKLKKILAPKKFTDEDVKNYLAGSFFQGKRFGYPKKYLDGQWEYSVDDHNNPADGEIEKEQRGNDPADRHSLSFFQKELDVRIVKSDYRVMNELAKNYDTFDEFFDAFKTFMVGNYPKSENAFDSTGFKKKELNKHLRQFWHKAANKMLRFDPVQQKGFLELEVVVDLAGVIHIKQKGVYHSENTPDGEVKGLADKRNVQDVHAMAFTDRDGVVTYRLNLGDIVATKENKKTKDIFWVANDQAVFSGDKNGNKREQNTIYIQDFAAQGAVYVASKGGDHSAILFTTVPEQFKNMDESAYYEYWGKELADGNITEDLLIDMEMDMGKGIPLSHIVAKHEWWKSVKYPKYLLGTHMIKTDGTPSESMEADNWKPMGVQDHYDRLKINMSGGFLVRDLGDSNIMTVDAETTFFEYPNGTRKAFSTQDGIVWSSGKWFKKLSKSLGESNLTVIKGMMRSRWGIGKNINYLGVKSIQARPYSGMKLVSEDGTVIAKYQGRSTEGTWVDANGNEFDHLASTDGSKMTNGTYAKFNEVQHLPAGYQNVIQLPGLEKNPAFPVTQGELAMDESLQTDPDGKQWIDSINRYYDGISKEYLDDLTSFISSPALIFKELNRQISENDIMTEMQKFVSEYSENGIGLIHPAILPMWIDSITNKFVKKGMLKVRSREASTGANLYYKPYYAPAMGNALGELRDGDFVVSAESKSMVKAVEAAYTKATGNILPKPKNIYDNHNSYWKVLNSWLLETDESGNYTNNVPVLLSRQPVAKITGVVMRNIRGLAMGGHGKTMMLSEDDVLKVFDGDWDGDKGLLNIISDKSVVDAYMRFQSSELFKTLDKVINLDYMGKRLGGTTLAKQADVIKTINNINGGIKQIGMVTNARNTLFSMSFKNLKLHFKGITVRPFLPTEITVLDYINIDAQNMTEEMFDEIYTRNNDKLVYSGRVARDLTEVKDWADFMTLRLDSKIVFHLKTTKQNEFSIILQMAVDDSKYGLLGSFKFYADSHPGGTARTSYELNNLAGIKFDNKFLISRMFKNYDKLLNQPNMTKIERTVLSQYVAGIKSAFNFSGLRQGYDTNHQQMKLEDIFNESQRLSRYGKEGYSEKIYDIIYHKILESFGIREKINEHGAVTGYYGDQDKVIKLVQTIQATLPIPSKTANPIEYEWGNKLTPQERLLLKLSEAFEMMPSLTNGANYNGILSYTKPDNVMAHRKTTAELNQRVMNQMEDKFEGEALEIDSIKGVSFAESFAEDYFKILDDRKGMPSIDFSEEIETLLDEYQPIWEKLTPRQQTMSTIHMFLGTTASFSEKGNAAENRVQTFFPTAVMRPEVVKLYLNDWYTHLTSDALHDVNDSKQESRRKKSLKMKEGGYRLGKDYAKLTKDTLRNKCE